MRLQAVHNRSLDLMSTNHACRSRRNISRWQRTGPGITGKWGRLVHTVHPCHSENAEMTPFRPQSTLSTNLNLAREFQRERRFLTELLSLPALPLVIESLRYRDGKGGHLELSRLSSSVSSRLRERSILRGGLMAFARVIGKVTPGQFVFRRKCPNSICPWQPIWLD